jgi:hypothetical protein
VREAIAEAQNDKPQLAEKSVFPLNLLINKPIAKTIFLTKPHIFMSKTPLLKGFFKAPQLADN